MAISVDITDLETRTNTLDIIPPFPAPYRILSSLTNGGMSEILLAECQRTKQVVVIKQPDPHKLKNPRDADMYHAEAAVMAQLQHPNVVSLIDRPMIDQIPCIAMEYVFGPNLRVAIRGLQAQERRIPASLSIHIICEVLKGLGAAHQARARSGVELDIVHRDVKPANILLSFNGEVKITDFGIARSKVRKRTTTAGVVKGTTRYLAPEQILGRPVTPATDVFAAASVLVELLSGEPLFERGGVTPTLHAIVLGDRAPIRSLLPTSMAGLANVLERALAHNPSDRYASAQEFENALRKAQSQLGWVADENDLAEFLQDLFPQQIQKAQAGLLPVDPDLVFSSSAWRVGKRPSSSPHGSGQIHPFPRLP